MKNQTDILWVDDNPQNNAFLREAFEQVGVQVTQALSTSEALEILRQKSFGVVISDMVRQEKLLEGYVLLDQMRTKGDQTPYFIYAGSAHLSEHKRIAEQRGAQGSTNHPAELFKLVATELHIEPPKSSSSWLYSLLDKPSIDTSRCPNCGTQLAASLLSGLCPFCLLNQGLKDAPKAAGHAFELPVLEDLMAVMPKGTAGVELKEYIGRGAMGAVYKGRQVMLNRIVAVKIMPPRAADGGIIIHRFEREARLLARLDHPNVISVYQFGLAGEYPYFTMDFVEGQNLRQRLKAGPVDPQTAIALFLQLCDGLQHAHENGIIHRDIKPENLLITSKNTLKIADFGLARLNGDSPEEWQTVDLQRIGTPHYMAPEQATAPKTVDHRADIYACGVVLYEMLTGNLPRGRFAPPSKKAAVAKSLDEPILKSLEETACRRHQSIQDFKQRVQEAALVKMPRVSRGRKPFYTARPDELTPAQTRTTEKGNLSAVYEKLKLAEQAQEQEQFLELVSSRPTGNVPTTLIRELEPLEQAAREGSEDAHVWEQLKKIYQRLNYEDGSLAAALKLCKIYRLQGRLAESILEGQRVLLRVPNDTALYRQVLHDMSAVDTMIRGYEEAAECRPTEYRYLEFLKRSYAYMDVDDKRDKYARKLAKAYELKGKWPQAITEYRELLVRHPEEVELEKIIADLEERQRQTPAEIPSTVNIQWRGYAQPGD